jgi:glycosyltransferase involved in cell wall biosynthesis
VTPDGGPKESIDDGRSGVVVAETSAARWAATMNELLDDEPRRQRMSHAAAQRAARYSLTRTFDHFWDEHLHACEAASAEPAPATAAALSPALTEK